MSRTLYSVTLFVLAMVAVLASRPSWVFEGATPRPFGVRRGQGPGHPPTVLSLGVVTCVLAILSVALTTLADAVLLAHAHRPPLIHGGGPALEAAAHLL